jgi:hypothetical protein
MTGLREAAQMALEALQESKPIDIDDPAAFYRSAHAIEALRKALAQPEREWQGLTDEERQECLYSDPIFGMAASTFAHAIEAKLKEKNYG